MGVCPFRFVIVVYVQFLVRDDQGRLLDVFTWLHHYVVVAISKV